MGEFLDAVTNGAIWGVGFGLGAAAVRTAAVALKPVARSAVKGTLAAGNWVKSASEESRESLQDLYHEAQAEREHGTGQPAGQGRTVPA